MELPYDTAMEHLGIRPREMKIHLHTGIGVQIFIAALVIIAKNWKLSKSSTNG